MIAASYVMLLVAIVMMLVMVSSKVVNPNSPISGIMMSLALLIIIFLMIGRMFFRK